MHDDLVRAAEERDLSVNYIVVKAVEDYLPRLIPAEEFSLARPTTATEPTRQSA
jgi:hypothetical protein